MLIKPTARFYPKALPLPLGYRRWEEDPNIIIPVPEEIRLLVHCARAMMDGASYKQTHRWLQIALQRKIALRTVKNLYLRYKKEANARKHKKAKETYANSLLGQYAKSVAAYKKANPGLPIEELECTQDQSAAGRPAVRPRSRKKATAPATPSYPKTSQD